ncbi:hypothetical protein ACOKW7_15910 [Limnospira platensis CENA597]|uniref:hypothetical protein n=1 Tax=Limnospira platensis TaxID=118562 RepID=UPI003D6FFF43
MTKIPTRQALSLGCLVSEVSRSDRDFLMIIAESPISPIQPQKGRDSRATPASQMVKLMS